MLRTIACRAGFLALLAASPALGQGNPVLDYLGHRFAIAMGPEGAECLAFDAANRHVAGSKIYDTCRNPVLDNWGGSGTAWDPVTQKYWYVSPDGEVGTYDGGPLGQGAANLDTLFCLPDTVDIAGIGPLALVVPAGIAADSTYLYVVTKGPDPGEASSGGWFKFLKDGTPVSHSGATDFNAELVEDPDALVDGITWVSPESPFAPGLFLVALEHSGIQVIDGNGFFVDRMMWSDEGLGFNDGIVPTAFAGVTIDPLTGDLFLVDNDRTLAQRWIHLGEGEPTASFVVSVGYEEGWIDLPTSGCSFPLWRKWIGPFEPDPLLFGIAYRNVDGLIYGADFNTGDLHCFDPRSGDLTLVMNLGEGNFWGAAYDAERDVLYLSEEIAFPFGNRLHVYDPSDSSLTALPNPVGHSITDIAFHPPSGFIFGTSLVGGNRHLILIDRNTGAGFPVGGPTAAGVVGLTWDPATGMLIGKGFGGTIWAIDPVSGSATILTTGASGGFEGLAAVWESDAATDAPEVAALATERLELRAWPNPFRAGTSVALEASRSGSAVASVYDLGGRLVRELHSEARGSGRVVLRWDGRDSSGHPVAAGVYFLRAATPGAVAFGKVVRID